MTPGGEWDFVCSDGQDCAVIRHRETGQTIGLQSTSNGWVRFMPNDTGPEHVEWSSGETSEEQWPAEERRLHGILVSSPGAHPLSKWLGSTTKFGAWQFTIADGGVVMLHNTHDGHRLERMRCLTAHGYERATSADEPSKHFGNT